MIILATVVLPEALPPHKPGNMRNLCNKIPKKYVVYTKW
jgi:hypothetical protein